MENTKAQIDAETEIRFSVFEISALRFGLDVLFIKEVIKPIHITRLPNAPHYVPGIINLRGKIISVVDLALFFGMQINEPHEYEGLIITESGSARFAVFYDRMYEFLKIKKSDLSESSEKIPESILPYLYGIYNNETILLNGADLFSDLKFLKL